MKYANIQYKARRLLILLIVISSTQRAFGYVELGYRVGLWLNPGGLNSIIREYNAANPWQKFHTVHGGNGVRMIAGGQMENISYFAGLKWLRTTQTASGIDPQTNAMDYKNIYVNYGGIIFGMQVNSESNFSVGFEVNAFNYYALRYKTSTTPNIKSAGDIEIINTPNPTISLYGRFALQHGFAGVTLIPAIDLPVFHGHNDISDLRKKLKLYAPSESKYMRGYNISLTLSLLLAKQKY